MIVIVESLHPSVSRLYGESTGHTLGGEQLIPVFFTVGQPVLQVEGRIGEQFAAVSTRKALRVEGLPHGLQTVLSFHFFRLSLSQRTVEC